MCVCECVRGKEQSDEVINRFLAMEIAQETNTPPRNTTKDNRTPQGIKEKGTKTRKREWGKERDTLTERGIEKKTESVCTREREREREREWQ